MDVAERLFAAQGFDGTSVRDIAHDAGVNVAMISYYFGSKEKLMEALFLHRISAGRLVLEHLLNDKEMHPMAKVEAIIEGIVDRMLQHHSFHRIMFREQLVANNEAVARLIIDMKLKNLEIVGKIIAEGQRKKVFVKGIDVALTMMTVIGTIYQAATTSTYLHISHPPETAISPEAYAATTKKKLKAHLKHTLKAILTYDGQ